MENPAEAVEEAKGNKRVALLIAALALALALTEVAGDDAKTEAQMKNVESPTSGPSSKRGPSGRPSSVRGRPRSAMLTPIANPGHAPRWSPYSRAGGQSSRWETEPETGEGRRELMKRAKRRRRSETGQCRGRPLRHRLRPAASRHRAGIGGDHHRHGGAAFWAAAALGGAGAVLSVLTFLGVA